MIDLVFGGVAAAADHVQKTEPNRTATYKPLYRAFAATRGKTYEVFALLKTGMKSTGYLTAGNPL